MKIPESIRIGGVEYPVFYVDNLNNGTTIAYGHIDYENCRVELSGTHGTAHEKRCITLLHDILHGIRYHANVEVVNEEDVVDMFAKGIYQVLQDNGARLFDIQSAEEGKTDE